MRIHVYAVVALGVLQCVAGARGEDAPQFRGPGGVGISKETNLPLKWSATENIRWKAPLPGKGLSNPVVADGRVYVTAAAGLDQKHELVLCFDVKTGKKLWQRQLWATGNTICHPKTNMAAPTPITDGQHVYALFATGDFVCYNRDGDLVWYRSLVGDYPTIANNVGLAASPTIWGDLILLCMENVGESFAAGIDKRTGENRWRVERPRGINWVSPIVIPSEGQAEVVFQGSQGLVAHDAATGEKKWTANKLSLANYVSLTHGDGIVYAPGGKFVAIRPGKQGKDPEILWQSIKLPAAYCCPIAHEGLVYVVSGGGVVNCADAKTGEIVWTERLENGEYTASPLLADGKLYVLNEKGATSVLQAGKEAKVLAVNEINDTFLATPFAADGAIFLRSDSMLYCIGKTN